MRLAVLADVHGNLQALEAVLDHAQKQNVDQIVIAGDLINYLADSRACWDLVQSLQLPMVRGNHERYVFHYDTPFAHPDWVKEQFMGLKWVVKQFSNAEREMMSALPLAICLENLLIVHASFRDDYDTISPETPVSELEKMFAGSSEQFIIRGHNHRSFSVKFAGRIIESLGSVGLPLDGTPEAKYAVAEKQGNYWHFLRHQVAYDKEKAVERLRESGYLEAYGPIGKIALRELQTSRDYIVRFWNEHEKWSQSKTLNLEQAVDNFLAQQS
jgi:predicted phosphodiesterase